MTPFPVTETHLWPLCQKRSEEQVDRRRKPSCNEEKAPNEDSLNRKIEECKDLLIIQSSLLDRTWSMICFLCHWLINLMEFLNFILGLSRIEVRIRDLSKSAGFVYLFYSIL